MLSLEAPHFLTLLWGAEGVQLTRGAPTAEAQPQALLASAPAAAPALSLPHLHPSEPLSAAQGLGTALDDEHRASPCYPRPSRGSGGAAEPLGSPKAGGAGYPGST